MVDLKYKPFLDMIAWSEGTSRSPITKNDGYDVIVSGVDGPSVFEDYDDHPFAHGGSVLVRPGPPPLYSTAAGRYQLLARFWNIYRVELDLADFSPASQDAVAFKQIQERGAWLDVDKGEIELAIGLCSNIWASLPGNNYMQGGHPIGTLVAKYTEFSTSGQQSA